MLLSLLLTAPSLDFSSLNTFLLKLERPIVRDYRNLHKEVIIVGKGSAKSNPLLSSMHKQIFGTRSAPRELCAWMHVTCQQHLNQFCITAI